MRQVSLILVVIVGLPVQAASMAPSGTFAGTGRSCHGSFAVTPSSIYWITPFSQCEAVPVQLRERQDEKGRPRVTYRLKRQPR